MKVSISTLMYESETMMEDKKRAKNEVSRDGQIIKKGIIGGRRLK